MKILPELPGDILKILKLEIYKIKSQFWRETNAQLLKSFNRFVINCEIKKVKRIN